VGTGAALRAAGSPAASERTSERVVWVMSMSGESGAAGQLPGEFSASAVRNRFRR
jgi:hypothetical protein